MSDVFTKQKRSQIMSKIRKKNSKPEILVRKFLFKNGMRYRIHNNKLNGNPDITLSKYRTVIFINGCFWHSHKNCSLNVMPKTNKEYWIPKLIGNAERDNINKLILKKAGWKVITIWECELSIRNEEKTLQKLLSTLNKIIEEDEIY
jgi:DNA mismatch endonuclease (patch repair protein)